MNGEYYSLEKQLDLLKKINRIKIGGILVYDYFSYQNSSLWCFYQHFIWRNIEQFGKNPDFFKKGKKVALNYRLFQFFIGFFIFIISSFSFLVFYFRKSKAVFQTLDKLTGARKNDQKLDVVYKFLADRKIIFGQFLRASVNKRTFVNFFKRGKLVFYLESADFLFSILPKCIIKKNFQSVENKSVDFSEFSENEKLFAEWILNKCGKAAELSVFKIEIFKKAVKLLKPKIFLMSDDYVYGNEIHLAAKLQKIKTYSFQHGRFNKFLPMFINYGIPPEKCLVFDEYFVWNDFWKNKLINLSPMYGARNSNVKVGGKPFFEKNREFIKIVPDGVITVLIPYETIAPKNEIREYIEKILSCPKTRIIFKLRKDINFDKQIEEAGLKEFQKNPRFVLESDLTPQILEKIDIVCGTYSTMLYEMVEVGKPIAIMKTSRSEAEDMVEDGLASWLDTDSPDFCGDLKKIAETNEKILIKNSDLLKTTVNLEDELKRIFYS
ncbi:hypothetical protein HZB06_03050 [Candidatus Wolfebacteria bacterium]|nr:hypothetical protein [Candidatus Wolfebacteria bacterium]